ncbi:hypothetical protein H6P81_006212 [Aristolochia fimbriata]|uniref:Protein kinase domain-containing protein n=1 Tax=Aristolochia fimbriata TaxID=158543 RepID=A0AAV7EWV5_ARIFI|nr:hypothetical protein H6P81_006212 [Aristolochia fimbriata]
MGFGPTLRCLGRRLPPISAATAVSLFKDGHCYITQGYGYRCWIPFNYLLLSNKLVASPSTMVSFNNKLSMLAGNILVQARDPSQLSSELLNAVDDKRFEDAWMLYEKYFQMEGLPRRSVLSKLIASLAETQKHFWLEKAYSIVETVINENKFDLLEKGTLIYLSYALARSELPVPASIILRKLVEKEEFVPVSAWSGIIAHMSQTPTGAILAADLVIEIGYLFKDYRVDPRKKCNQLLLSMKPNMTAMSIALTGCLLFGTTRKGEEVLELMPRLGVKPNLTLLIIMAHIYERNGRREEIKKLKRFIDETPNVEALQLQQYYNCLLSCHLKFADLGLASEMVLEMLRKAKEAQTSLAAVTNVLEAMESDKSSSLLRSSVQTPSLEIPGDLSTLNLCENPLPSYVEFSTDKRHLSLETEGNRILDGLLANLQTQVELVTTENGILRATERTYAKLVTAFLEANKIKDLAEFLIRTDKEDSPSSVENSAVVHVINACISLGLLDQAYDLLDELRFAGIKTGSSVYSSLLKAYCKENRSREVQSLLQDARKAGIQLDSTCYEALIESRVIDKDTYGALNLFKEMKEAKISKSGHLEFANLVKGCSENGEAGLMSKLLAEIKEGQTMDCGLHDWNNVIHFFCKKRLMHDAQKAFKKMTALGHRPNAQTFHSLVTGYAAVGGKYLEVAELWGEMKVLYSSGAVKFDQELLDSLLYCFVRGGFFLRANEVVSMMEKQKLFIDKYKYRILFLKYHKTLYKGKAPKFQTEAQLKRRDAALEFKKWIGLGVNNYTMPKSEKVIGIRHVIPPPNPEAFTDVCVAIELMDTDLYYQIIGSNQDLSEEHCQYFLYQILCGLKYIHSAKVLHRDLKPSNLLLKANCDLKICDFGLARPTLENEFLTEYVVTRWYRAPELLLNSTDYTVAIDVWSVGCIFMELMNRQPLFAGRDHVHRMKLLTELLGTPNEAELGFVKNEDVKRFYPHVHVAAIDLVERMLTFDPAKRITECCDCLCKTKLLQTAVVSGGVDWGTPHHSSFIFKDRLISTMKRGANWDDAYTSSSDSSSYDENGSGGAKGSNGKAVTGVS